MWCLVWQKSWSNIHEHAHMLIPTPDKDDDPVRVDYSRFIHLSVVPTRATPLPALGWVCWAAAPLPSSCLVIQD